MSRVAKKPVALPKGVELNVQADSISAKGPKGTLSVPKPEFWLPFTMISAMSSRASSGSSGP